MLRNQHHLFYWERLGIPHNGIPGKIRVVFGCSAEVGGESINRNVMTDPDLTSLLAYLSNSENNLVL